MTKKASSGRKALLYPRRIFSFRRKGSIQKYIQAGIWIDKRWLQQAGLGERLQIAIKQGEIRIIAAPEAQKLSDSTESVWTEKATETFRSLWRDAEPGKLHNPSENHNLYLYGKGT